MPVRLDISNFKCFNQLRNDVAFDANTSEFTGNTVGNAGELLKVSYNATFNYFSNANISNKWLMKTNKITRSFGNFQTDDGLVIGDRIVFFADWENNDTATPEFEALITGFSDGGSTLLFSVDTGSQTSTGSLDNAGFICDPNDSENIHSALFLRFGLVPNDDSYSNTSLVSGNSQTYTALGLTGITAPIEATPEGIYRDWVSGSLSAFIESVDVSGRTVTYKVEHEFKVLPSYIVSYLQNLQGGTIPDLFAGDSSLKYAFQIELRKSKTDIATAKTATYDSLQGSVGWVNESFNGGQSDYSAIAVYEDTANTEAVSSLQVARKTTARITVSKESTPFTAGQTAIVYIDYLPLNESEYTNTTTDYDTNFIADSIRIVEGASEQIATGVIKRAVSVLAGDDLSIEVDFEYTPEQAQRINEGYYKITVACEDSALSAGNSDRVMVLADIKQYQALGLISGLLTFDKFDLLVHNEELGIDAGSLFAQAWNEDGLLLDFAFSLELAQDAFINELALKLVAFKTADESYFELDRYVIDCNDFPVSGGSQQLKVDTTRGYNLAEGDQFNFVKLETGSKVGMVQSYTGSFGQKITWQDWIANINADTVFYDETEPQNNLNQKSSNYSGLEGYVIKIIAEASLTGTDDLGNAGQGFERGEVEAITVNDYGVSDDGVFTAVDIELLDPDTEEDLEAQADNDKPTLFRSTFTTSDDSTSNVWAIHRLYDRNAQGNNLIAELSSIHPYPADNALIPIDGQTQLYIYASGGNIITECLIDNNRIDPSKDYRVTARIDRASEVLLFSTVFDSGVSGFLTAQVTNLATGAWILGSLIVSGNTLNTDDSYLDGELRLIKYSASSFAALTAIDIDDIGGRGVLDLSSDSLTALLNVTAQGNQYDTVLFGEWVQTTLVDIDLTNSIINVDVLALVIDNLIIANGGTTTDDGVNYTGSAGVTSAGRTLAVGTITIDITTTGILYEKIIALEGVGWTITTIITICNKTLVVNTGATYFASGFIEKTRELIAIDYISGDPLTIKLYDTEANANAGGATGLLADGYTAVDTWLRDDTNYNAWVAGTNKGLRFEAIDTGSTDNLSNLRYKATPTEERPCGENDFAIDYREGNAQDFDGVFNFDTISGLPTSGLFTYAGERAILFEVEFFNNNCTIFAYGNAGGAAFPGGFLFSRNSSDGMTLAAKDTGGNSMIVSTPAISDGKHTIIITKGSTWMAADIDIYIGGVQQTKVVGSDNITSLDVNAGSPIVFGRRSNNSSLYFEGKYKQFEILDFKPTALQITQASTGGSFRAAGIAHNSGNYAAAVDFDKVSGNPTSYPDTPLITIAVNGGDSYSEY